MSGRFGERLRRGGVIWRLRKREFKYVPLLLFFLGARG
jgi:hypothetical protein